MKCKPELHRRVGKCYFAEKALAFIIIIIII